MNEKQELVNLLNTELSLELPVRIGMEELRKRLSGYIHSLISENFHKLVAILYRVDVSEEKLRSLLKEHPDQDAGLIIADLIIERQEQKIKSRQFFDSGNNKNDMDEEEKW